MSGRLAKSSYCLQLLSSLERASPRPNRNRRSISLRVKFLSEHNLRSSIARKTHASTWDARLTPSQPTTLAHLPFPCCKRRSPRRIHPKYGNDNPSAALLAAAPHTPEELELSVDRYNSGSAHRKLRSYP